MTGYILIDLAGIDLSAESAATVAGSYAKLSEAIATNKPIIIEGLVNDDTAISPVSVLIYTDTDGIEVEFNTTKITVSSADSVTISSLIPAPEAKTTTRKTTTKEG
jgi:archaellin